MKLICITFIKSLTAKIGFRINTRDMVDDDTYSFIDDIL